MEPMKDEILKGLRSLEGFLDRLPGPIGSGLRERIAELRELLVEHRPPRIVLVGRRGTGKSSLINAIFDQPLAAVGHTGRGTLTPRWYSYTSERGALEVLDTRGLGEALRAGEPDAKRTAVAAIVEECRKRPPDSVLFLVKAKEIESRTDEDVVDLATVCGAIGSHQGAKPAIIGVVNQCDELSPPTVRLDQPSDGERYRSKLENVRIVEQKLAESIALRPELVSQWFGSVGIVSYAEWEPSGALVEDLRWRVSDLVNFLFQHVPLQAQLELVRLSQVRGLQQQLAQRIVYATAALCGSAAAVPLPFADIMPITAAQVGMITAIGYVGGRELSARAAGEFLVALGVNVGAGFVFREIARGLIRWVFPGGGSVISAAVAYAATLGLGMAAIAYFIEGKSIKEAQAEYESTRFRGEREYGADRDVESRS